MKSRPSVCIVLSTIIATSLSATAGQPASFSALPPLPLGSDFDEVTAISPDGEFVAGVIQGDDAFNFTTHEGFLWSQSSGRIMLGRVPGAWTSHDPSNGYYKYVTIFDVANNAARVVGHDMTYRFEPVSAAFSWTPELGSVEIGVGSFSLATGVSADGSTVCGGNYMSSNQAGIWTDVDGWSFLDSSPNDGTQSGATAISNDGTVIVGWDRTNSSTFHSFRWTAVTGMTQISNIDPSFYRMRGQNVSGDGSVVFGNLLGNDNSITPFVWTVDAGLTFLPHPPNLIFQRSTPLDSNLDGSVFVGQSYNNPQSDAVIWDQSGVRILQEVLTEAGLDLTGWTLTEATSMSDDGITIAGNGIDPSGIRRAWIATLPPATTSCNPADLNADGALNFFDISAFLSAFANQDPIADFSNDGLFNFFDISAFLNVYSTGCP